MFGRAVGRGAAVGAEGGGAIGLVGLDAALLGLLATCGLFVCFACGGIIG